MNISVLDPLVDKRWDDLVARHPSANVFHERGWVEALVRTYGYQPLVLTSASPGEPLTDGIVLCRVSSWLTGTRLVSIPFADHCEPLFGNGQWEREFGDWLQAKSDREALKYVELRARSHVPGATLPFQKGQPYYFHTLDLTPSFSQIFDRLHKDCIRRRIRRAEKAGLLYQRGIDNHLLDDFYNLLVVTRRRHRLVPQPRRWFNNLIECMGNKIQIRVARKQGSAVAAILCLVHRTSVIYKYGCSDARYHHLGGMPFLFWKLIEESKEAGAEQIDFGRSDVDNKGLIVFKDRLGARKSLQTYLIYHPTWGKGEAHWWNSPIARRLVPMLPLHVLPLAGRIMYRHVG